MRTIIGSLFPNEESSRLVPSSNGLIISIDKDQFKVTVVYDIPQALEFARHAHQTEKQHLMHITQSTMPRASDEGLLEFGGQSARAIVTAFFHLAREERHMVFSTAYPAITMCVAWPSHLLAPGETPNMLFGYFDIDNSPHINVVACKSKAHTLIRKCSWAPAAHRNTCHTTVDVSALPEHHDADPLRITEFAAYKIHEMFAVAHSHY